MPESNEISKNSKVKSRALTVSAVFAISLVLWLFFYMNGLRLEEDTFVLVGIVSIVVIVGKWIILKIFGRKYS